MSHTFAHLDGLSARLNESSDLLIESIKLVEAKLASMRLGVEAWVKEPLETETTLDDKGDPQDKLTTWFGYAKVGADWGLYIRENSERWDECDGSPWPSFVRLQQASRELRIKAIQQLPDLIKELEARAEAALKAIERATIVAKAISS